MNQIPSLRQTIRETTRPLHEKLDHDPASLRVLEKTVTLADYAAFLGRTYGFLQPIEEALFSPAVSPLMQCAFPDRHRRANLILDDLRALGVSQEKIEHLPQMTGFAPPASLGEAMGVSYVIEGSAIGGLVIAKSIGLRLGLPQGPGLTFLLPEQAKAIVRRFESFSVRLDSFAECGCDRRKAMEGAERAFRAIGDWFDKAPKLDLL